MTQLEERFDGRGVLVTGGASGIGLAIAGEFLAEGATVLIADRDREALAGVADQLGPPDRLLSIEADLAEPRSPARLASEATDRLGQVDVLVNNAGLMRQTPVLEITLAEWEELFATNLRAVFFLTQALAAGMAERGRGAVV